MKTRRTPRILQFVISFTVAAVAATGPAPAQDRSDGWAGQVNLLGGAKLLENDWKPADDQTEFGVQTDFRPPEWPVAFALDVLFARSASESVALPAGGAVSLQGETVEVGLGFRGDWEHTERWRPFLGGGLALLRGELETQSPGGTSSNSDSGTGFWLAGGLYYVFADRINLGAQARFSSGDVDINGEKLDAGGVHFGALLGFRW